MTQTYDVEHYPNGKIWYERYFLNGKFHRDEDKPAYIEYYQNGAKRIERYFSLDKLHREGDNPAVIGYYPEENGIVVKRCEEYWINDTRHRTGDKPSFIEYYPSGNIKNTFYRNNGKLYRENNLPQQIKYSEDGTIETHIWFDKDDDTVLWQEVHNINNELTKACKD